MTDNLEKKLPIPPLPTTAYTAKWPKKERKRKTNEEKKCAKQKEMESKRARDKTRIYIGDVYERWRELRDSKGLRIDAELAVLLLDSYLLCDKDSSTSPPEKCDFQTQTTTTTPPISSICAAADQQASISINDAPKYVVDEGCLLQLFEECPVCSSMCEVQKRTRETFLTVYQLCPQCHFNRNWRSQPTEKAVTLSDDRSCTNDPERSAAAITEIIGFSDKNDSSEEGSSKVDNGECNSDSDWNPPDSHNQDKSDIQAVPSSDAHSCTNDPESSVAAITEIIGFSDENDSSDDGSSEVDDGENNSDRDWKPKSGHFQIKSDIQVKSSTYKKHDKKHEKKLCPKCNTFYSYKHHICKYQKPYYYHDKRSLLCPECGTFFRNQKTHTCKYKNPYSCLLCGKRFLEEGRLKVHSKIHKDGYKHVCKYCCSTFRTRHDKLLHEQSHLQPPAEKPYQCPDCPQVFAKIQERREHLLTHRGPTRHICQICNMEFPNNSTLERHVVVHTKEKQFVCEVCQRSFTQPSHLKSHMRLHTGEKPYQCQHCDKSFNHNVSLKSHIQRYHGQVPDPGMKVMLEKTTRNESEVEKDETQEMESNAVDAEEAERSKDTLCNTESGSGDEKKEKGRKRKGSTGRPIGRPKKRAVITSDDANQLKRQLCIGDENREGQGSSDSANEEQENDRDSDFDPAGHRTKKKGGAQSCRGRPKKNDANQLC